MATIKEIKTLSDPAIYVDGKRLKIISNSCTAEMPGEVASRAVSAGGGAIAIVHGVNTEAYVCMVRFDLANTAENMEFVLDYKERARTVSVSTLQIVEDSVQLNYDTMILTNKVEASFDSEGVISVEFSGRYAGV